MQALLCFVMKGVESGTVMRIDGEFEGINHGISKRSPNSIYIAGGSSESWESESWESCDSVECEEDCCESSEEIDRSDEELCRRCCGGRHPPRNPTWWPTRRPIHGPEPFRPQIFDI